MKAVWTASGGGAVTLADDKATPRIAMQMEQFGLMGKEQLEPLFGGASMYRAPLGNTSGDCIFTATKSHGSRDVAASYFAGEVLRISQAGVLVLTIDAVTLTMNPANCRGVVVAKFNGVQWVLRYTFGITTIVTP